MEIPRGQKTEVENSAGKYFGIIRSKIPGFSMPIFLGFFISTLVQCRHFARSIFLPHPRYMPSKLSRKFYREIKPKKNRAHTGGVGKAYKHPIYKGV